MSEVILSLNFRLWFDLFLHLKLIKVRLCNHRGELFLSFNFFLPISKNGPFRLTVFYRIINALLGLMRKMPFKIRFLIQAILFSKKKKQRFHRACLSVTLISCWELMNGLWANHIIWSLFILIWYEYWSDHSCFKCLT